MKSRSIVIVMVLLGIILAFSPLLAPGCQVAQKEKAPYKIGIIQSLTGQYAPLGVDAKMLEEMAIEEINAAGGINGRQLVAIYYDDESMPPRAADLVRKLKDQNVLAIIGGQGSPIAMSASEAANTEKVPFFSKTPVTLPLESVPGSYHFAPPLGDFGVTVEFWVRHAIATGGKRIGVILTADPMGDMYDKLLKTTLEKNPGLFEVVGTERMLTTDTDITPQLTKLKALKPDALFVGPSGRPATVVYKNLDLMSWDIPAIASSSNATKSFIDSVKGFSHRVTMWLPGMSLRPDTIPEDDPAQVERMRALAIRFNKETGKILQDSALGVYDSIYALADVIAKLKLEPEKQGVQEMRDKMREALETQSFKGTALSIKRTPQDHRGTAAFRIYLAKIEGDWFVPVRWIDFPSRTSGEVKLK